MEEKKELAEEEKVIHRYLTYVERLEKAYETLQKMSEEATRVIGEVENLLSSGLNWKIFFDEKNKIRNLKKKIEGVISNLKGTVERYGRLFEELRVNIIYEVKNLCRELLGIEREIVESEKAGTPTRAS